MGFKTLLGKAWAHFDWFPQGPAQGSIAPKGHQLQGDVDANVGSMGFKAGVQVQGEVHKLLIVTLNICANGHGNSNDLLLSDTLDYRLLGTMSSKLGVNICFKNT